LKLLSAVLPSVLSIHCVVGNAVGMSWNALVLCATGIKQIVPQIHDGMMFKRRHTKLNMSAIVDYDWCLPHIVPDSGTSFCLLPL
jgi:hypothetical protein